MKLEKDGVIKDIDQEGIIGDYVAAGWKKYDEPIKIEKSEEKSSR